GLDGVEHRDDRLGGMEFVFADLSPYGHRAAIEASDTPLFVQTGWYDAFTADGALARYLTFSNPQTIWIGAWAHGGDRDTDPFRHVDSEPRPDPPAQWARIASFFDQTLVRNEVVKESSIEFAILGTDEWRKSETWPPQGVGELTLFLSDVGSLSRTAPPEATDTRAVDFSATMGNRTRIHTNFGRGDVVYENLQAQAERSWVFETNPLDRDIEIVGSASLALEAAIESTSTAFHGYLEAVLQSGEVVYLTEAVARASMSTPTSDPLPYVSAGSFPSFSRSAVRPLTGEKQSFILAFSNVATRVPEGARIRLRLAGADTGIYEPYPDTEEAVWTVHFGEEGSRLILPTFSK
ncbi:MAG: CocE/NonD family hydrolase, partial [Pseudomonadota bacterium]